MLGLILRSVNYSLYLNDLTKIQLENAYIPVYLNDYFIKDSFFQSMTFRAVSIYTDQLKNVVIDSTVFYNISSPYHSGAIYVVTGGNILVNKVCGFRCFTQNPAHTNQFGIVLTGNNYNNGIYYTSLSYCPTQGDRQYSMQVHFGNQILNGINYSYNTNSGPNSGLYLYETQPFQFLYSNYYNNVGNGQYSFRIYAINPEQGDIKHCNFINNRMTDWGNTVFYFYGEASFLIEKCVFARNLGTLFRFHTTTAGNFILLSCSIAHQYSGTYLATVSATVKSVVVTSVVITQSLALEHLSTVYCIADLPFSSESISELCLPPTPPQSLPPIPTDCFVESITGSSLINVLTMVKTAIAYVFVY